MSTLRAFLGGLVLGLAFLCAACSRDTGRTYPPVPAGLPDAGFGSGPGAFDAGPGGSDAGTGGTDGGADGGADGGTSQTELTSFVRDLILFQTADDNLPTTTEDKPLVDTSPTDAFPPSFFQ